jgi:hypothetical protein
VVGGVAAIFEEGGRYRDESLTPFLAKLVTGKSATSKYLRQTPQSQPISTGKQSESVHAPKLVAVQFELHHYRNI